MIMNIVMINEASNIWIADSFNWWYSYYFINIIFNANTYYRRKNHKSDNEMMIIKLMHIVGYWANDGILYITITFILLPYYYHYYYIY